MLRFIEILIILLFLQYTGGGIPKEQDLFFYIGYFFLPLLLAISINFLIMLFTKES